MPFAFAQSYPARPVRLIVASGTGGGLDYVARLIAPRLSESLGQSMVVDNRAGASGSIAGELTARAAPDGYTLILLSASLVVYASVNSTRFDLVKDFAPVTQVTEGPYVLVANASLPAKSVRELIAYAKSNPGKLNYASTGNATLNHLATELFAISAGITLVHIPYKGVGAAYPDLFANQVQLTFVSIPSAAPHIRAQRLRGLAVTGASRSKAAPELPTIIEAGVPGFVVTQWHGMLAPRGTPSSVIDRLHRDIASALQQPDIAQRLAADGSEPVGSAPREFGAHLKAERERWVTVARQTGIRAD
jgi:tripartite-type tricarboxylate transporter receptor subunit TctC